MNTAMLLFIGGLSLLCCVLLVIEMWHLGPHLYSFLIRAANGIKKRFLMKREVANVEHVEED